MSGVHPHHGYCSAVRKDQLLMQAPTWMDPKGIPRSEQSKSGNITHHMILFIKHSPNENILEMERRLVVSTVGGGGEEWVWLERRGMNTVFGVVEQCCILTDWSHRCTHGPEYRTTHMHCIRVRLCALKLCDQCVTEPPGKLCDGDRGPLDYLCNFQCIYNNFKIKSKKRYMPQFQLRT